MELKHYHAEVSDGKGLIPGSNSFGEVQYRVIGENARWAVIDDACFTTLSKDVSSSPTYYPVISVPSIHMDIADKVWGSRVTYNLYTYEPKAAKVIRREIEAAIKKKVGFFLQGVNLEFIKDEA